MKQFGLTGGIATGKSAVATILREVFHVSVIDADQLARDIVAPGQPALEEIRERFGPQVILPDGSLNRKALGARVMSDENERLALNAITHPRIFQAIREALERCETRGETAAVIEAALMVETGSYRNYDALLVVDCSDQRQLDRLMARDQLSEEKAKQWIASQMPLSEKRAVADLVIHNNGTLSDLHDAVRVAWYQLVPDSASVLD